MVQDECFNLILQLINSMEGICAISGHSVSLDFSRFKSWMGVFWEYHSKFILPISAADNQDDNVFSFLFSSKNNAYEMSPGCGNLRLYTEPNNTPSNCLYSFLFHKSYSGKGIIRNFQDNQSSAFSALDFFDGLRMLVCSLCGDNVLVCLLTIKLFIVSLFRQAAIKQ